MGTQKGSILLTGANGDIGSAIASEILSTPDLASYYGLYAVRNIKTATQLSKVLQRSPPDHRHDVVPLELSSLASVRALAADINHRVASGSLPRIRVIIVNAGYFEWTGQHFTDDGMDMSFQANYLGHWLLILLLLKSMDEKEGRVVVVSSSMHDAADPQNKRAGPVFVGEYEKIFHGTEGLAKGTWSSSQQDKSREAGMRRYAAAKLCNVMNVLELQKRLDADPALSNISILGIDPGHASTAINRHAPWPIRFIVTSIMPAASRALARIAPAGTVRLPATCATDILRACFDTKEVGERPKGKYLHIRVEGAPSAEALDSEKREMLWKDSIRYAGLKDGDTSLANWQ